MRLEMCFDPSFIWFPINSFDIVSAAFCSRSGSPALAIFYCADAIRHSEINVVNNSKRRFEPHYS